MAIRRWMRAGVGQSLVEFALVLPILMLLILGIFDLGWAVYARNTLADAAREGARTGIIISATDDQIRTRVRAAAPALGLTYDSQIQISPSTRTFGSPITVTVIYTYNAITPLIGQFVSGTGLALKGSSSMIVEGVIAPSATATPGATSTPSQTPTITSTPTVTSTPTKTLVPDFTLSASPNSLTLSKLASGNVTITLTSVNGFSAPVTLSVSGLQGGVSATLAPNPATPTGTSTMTVTAGNSSRTLSLTITGTGGGRTHTTIVAVTVQ